MNQPDEQTPYFQPASYAPDVPIKPFGGKELKIWTSKGIPHSVRAANIFMGVVCIFPILIILYEYIADRSAIGAVRHTDISTFGLCFWLFLWKKGILQKNVYKSRISEVGGQANYWADIPENMDVLFKWLVGTSLFLVACMIAVMPSAIWVLAGPGGIAIIASKLLIKWKREIKHTQFRWKKINWIVIDKKQKLIVLTSHWDATRTFEDQYVYFQIFVPKDEMDDFIKIAKYHAPTCTHFEQCHWDGCNE